MSSMWDHSSILLSNNAGARIGAGLAGLGDGISRGIEDYRRKKKDKEAEEAAVSWLQKNGQAMGLEATDEGELKAAVKAAGGGLQAIQLISGLEAQKRQREMQQQQMQVTAAQLQDLQSRRSDRLRSAGAARLAAGGPATGEQLGALVQGGARFEDLAPAEAGGSPDALVADYLRRSGDIGGAGDLATAYSRLGVLGAKERGPYAVDFGNGMRGVVANGNFILDPRLRQDPEKPVTREIDVGGQKMTVGPGDKYFDKDGKPVNFGTERAPSPPPFELKTTDPELYEAMKAEYLDYRARRGSAPAPAAAAAGAPGLSDQDEQALAWANAHPKDPRAAQIKQRLGVK